DPLGVRGALDLKRERKPLWFLVATRRYVTTHQHVVAKCQAAVHHLVLPVGRDLVRERSPGVTEDCTEFAPETLRVKRERRLALSLEAEIGAHLHDEPLADDRVRARGAGTGPSSWLRERNSTLHVDIVICHDLPYSVL